MTVPELIIKYSSKITETKTIMDSFHSNLPDNIEGFCLSRIKIYEEILTDLEEEGPSSDT